MYVHGSHTSSAAVSKVQNRDSRRSAAGSHGGDGRGRGVFSPANADANGTAATASARYSTSAADLASCHGLASENASGTAGASSDRRQSFISSSHCQAKSAR